MILVFSIIEHRTIIEQICKKRKKKAEIEFFSLFNTERWMLKLKKTIKSK